MKTGRFFADCLLWFQSIELPTYTKKRRIARVKELQRKTQTSDIIPSLATRINVHPFDTLSVCVGSFDKCHMTTGNPRWLDPPPILIRSFSFSFSFVHCLSIARLPRPLRTARTIHTCASVHFDVATFFFPLRLSGRIPLSTVSISCICACPFRVSHLTEHTHTHTQIGMPTMTRNGHENGVEKTRTNGHHWIMSIFVLNYRAALVGICRV